MGGPEESWIKSRAGQEEAAPNQEDTMKGVLLNELRFCAYFHRGIAMYLRLALFSSHFTLVWDGWISEESGTDVEKLEEAAQNKEDNIKGVLFCIK